MKTGNFLGEFDDYKYPFLNSEIPPEDLQEISKSKEKAMEDAIRLAEELDEIYGD